MWCSKKLAEIEKGFLPEDIDKLHNNGRQAIDAVLTSVTNKSKDDKSKDEFWQRWSHIREMLQHVNDRVNYWETRRTQFLQIGIGLLAASIAGILAIAGDLSSPTDLFIVIGRNHIDTVACLKGALYCFTLIVCLCFAIGSVKLLKIWNTQNNPDYPFTKGYRTWVWHYRHAEENSLSTDVHNFSEDTFRVEVEKFSKNLLFYKERMLNSSLAELLDQDLSQLYVLLINEKFKIDMVSRLRDCLLKTAWFALCTPPAVLILLSILRIAVFCSRW